MPIYCIKEVCETRASFNLSNLSESLYCSKHKLKDMINILANNCKFEGCITQPSYNFAGKTKPLYCVKHKQDNMIDLISK